MLCAIVHFAQLCTLHSVQIVQYAHRTVCTLHSIHFAYHSGQRTVCRPFYDCSVHPWSCPPVSSICKILQPSSRILSPSLSAQSCFAFCVSLCLDFFCNILSLAMATSAIQEEGRQAYSSTEIKSSVFYRLLSSWSNQNCKVCVCLFWETPD